MARILVNDIMTRFPLGGMNPGPHQIYRHTRLSVETRELPEVVPKNDIRLEMVCAGVRGTDVHLSQAHSDTGCIRSSAPGHHRKAMGSWSCFLSIPFPTTASFRSLTMTSTLTPER